MDDKLKKGEILKETRLAKNLSLQTVHEATKIPLDSLKAIEEGYKVRTLTDFYYRAFVKMYAKYLGLDVSVVLEDYQPEHLPPVRRTGRTPLSLRVPAISFSPKLWMTIAKAAAGIIVLVLLVRTVSCTIKKITTSVNAKKTEAVTTKDKDRPGKDSVEAKKAEAETAEAKVAKTVAVPQTPKLKSISIVARAKKKTWLRVKVDGAEKFRSTLAAGLAESWEGKKEIEVTGKSLEDVEFEVNGKFLSSAERKGRKMKGIVVTPSGFRILE